MSASFRNLRILARLATIIALLMPLMALADENPLQAHRNRAARNTFDTVQIRAVVAQTIGDSQLVIAIPHGQLKSTPFDEGDRARIHIAGKTLDARFVSMNTYRQLMQNPALRDTLDVDVLCLLDDPAQPGAWVVAGLGGGLVEWLQAKPGMIVTIEKDIK